MNTTASPACPRCGAPLPPDAPQGLCPSCLVALPLGEETAFTGEGEPGPTRAPLSPEEIAPHFPQLEILECLGRGGMGVVYRARQKSLGREVALKLLAPEREKDPQFAERFTREAQALARLDHPHIVTVYDFGQTDRFFYLLMEFVDGVNLRHLLQARKLSPEEALSIVPPLCEALQFAHERGIVHRDIKPENLLLAKDGRVKIADFGIAKMLGPEAIAADDMAAGTPGYMAPEQAETPQSVDSRADIYSLGVVFYEMLTGELPTNRLDPPSSRRRGVHIDVRIDEIVLRALEHNPELRFQTAAELGSRVETVRVEEETPLAPRPLRDWERRWLAQPLSRRRTIFVDLFILALVLLVIFLWPSYSVTSSPRGGQAVWSWGFAQPWLVETKVFGALSQSWSALHVNTTSFVIGVIGAAIWGLLCLLLRIEGRAAEPESALLRITLWQGNRRHIRWGRALLAALIFQGALLEGVSFAIAGMLALFGGAPSLLPTGFLTVNLAIIAVVAAIRAERNGPAADGVRSPGFVKEAPRDPWPHRLLWLVLSVFAGWPLLLFLGVILPKLQSMRMDRGEPPYGPIGYLLILPLMVALFFGYRLTRPLDATPRPLSKISPWPRRFFFLLLTIPVLIVLIIIGIAVPAYQRQHTPSAQVEALSPLPGVRRHLVSSINDAFLGVLYAQDSQRLHFALVHAGGFQSTTGSGSDDAINGIWVDEGTISLRNDRSFAYRRTSADPQHLSLNGTSYDLQIGTLFDLGDDGRVFQVPVFPAPLTNYDSARPLLSLIESARHRDEVEHPFPAKLIVGQWYNFSFRDPDRSFDTYNDPRGWSVTNRSAKVVSVSGEAFATVTFPAQPEEHWRLVAPQAGHAVGESERKAGSATGFHAREKSVEKWKTEILVLAEVARITPFETE